MPPKSTSRSPGPAQRSTSLKRALTKGSVGAAGGAVGSPSPGAASRPSQGLAQKAQPAAVSQASQPALLQPTQASQVTQDGVSQAVVQSVLQAAARNAAPQPAPPPQAPPEQLAPQPQVRAASSSRPILRQASQISREPAPQAPAAPPSAPQQQPQPQPSPQSGPTPRSAPVLRQDGGTGGYPAEAPAPRTPTRATTPPRSLTPTRASTTPRVTVPSAKSSAARPTRPTGQPSKEHQGAHYAYISPELADIRANEHDLAALDLLQPKSHRSMPSSLADGSTTDDISPRSTTPVKQRTAFTDRSARMREGVGARLAMMNGQELLVPEEQDHTAGAHAMEEMQALSRNAAGVMSHRMWNHADDRTEPRPKLIRETVGEQFAKIYANSTVGFEEQAQDDNKQRKQCGRKARAGTSPSAPSGGRGAMLPHRGHNVEDEPAAGVLRHIHPDEPLTKARSVTPTKRSGAAQVFQPQDDDVIEKPKKGVKEGEFSSGYSQECARHAIHGHALQLRYANWDQAPKVTKSPNAENFVGAAGAKLAGNSEIVSARGTPLVPQKTRSERGVSPRRNLINVEEMNRAAEQDRIARLQKDSCFADLVQHAQNGYEARRVEKHQTRAGGGKLASNGVAAIMSWDA